ncbi:MAG TPA: peptidoglycan recognition family protein [Oscillospiraceae bacterium]|nr:peptidoglycan recognition family protein [Oscillospiraceae bacterium]
MNPNKIIIHHSATTDNRALKDFDAIKNSHLRLGYRNIGYHYVVESVDNEYKTIAGRAENETGAHTVGQNNNSIGICLVGNFTYNEPPQGQLKATANLIKDIYSRHGKLPIYGHKDFNATQCPGNKFNMDKLKQMVEVNELEEYTDINAIAWELGHRGIISDNDLWIGKANVDTDIYWLMRKMVHYVRQRD